MQGRQSIYQANNQLIFISAQNDTVKKNLKISSSYTLVSFSNVQLGRFFS